MGNVNGREDDDVGGANNSSGYVHEEEDAIIGGGAPVPLMPPPELMTGGQSPPHSPRTTHSPLMFTPQWMRMKLSIEHLSDSDYMLLSAKKAVPVLPLQKPDEMIIPSHSWMNSNSGHEDLCNEQGIPTMITWSYGGKDVAVEGSWDNWKTRVPLQRSGKDFTIMKVLPSGVYQYRFIVDGQGRYASEIPWAQDDSGNAYNILDLEHIDSGDDYVILSSSRFIYKILSYDLDVLEDYVPEDLESISGFESPQSPDSSYSNLQLGSEDFAKEPPLVPPHLQMTLLNVPASYMEIPPPFSRPPHVVLNHLYMQKGKSGPSVVALGSTSRFRAKYVTVVLYKSMQR
ncbi:hypothetical protein ACFE04_000992 [Oxalis oulophora]